MKLSDQFGFRGAVFDSRLVEPGMLYVALKGEKADGNDFIPQARERGAAKVIGGPDALKELQSLAHDFRRAMRPRTAVVAVTGSAGKTTTKELLKAFLSRIGRTHATSGNFNNHLGLPMTVLNCPDDADFLVVEMGTNHPGEIAALCDIAEPDAGLITNIGTAHMEFFGSQDGIAREKGTLFARLGEGAGSQSPRGVGPFAVVSRENARLEILRSLCKVPLVEADPRQEWLAEALKDVLPGAHNVSNACLAFALAERYGVTREMAVAAIRDFGALPGARWRRTERGGVIYIDDTYNASPDSMTAALDAFAAAESSARRRIAVLGDMLELGADSDAYHAKVFAHAAGLGLDAVFAVGERSSKCRATAVFPTVAAFAEAMPSLLRAGDAVLLKASHSMSLGGVVPA
jgi:UDP-N-acetylmuramoyl-tripeptide--D-alanyl-D-alanine ligase